MINKIILASRSEVRKKILNQNGISCEAIPADIDENQVKESLFEEKATPEIISKNLAELKANKVSEKKPNKIILGADSVLDLNGELISKPTSRKEALTILQKLNGQKHQLISSVCISKNGSMIWNSTDASTLTMKQLNLDEIKSYLTKIKDKELHAYGVYQIEADGRFLFSKIRISHQLRFDKHHKHTILYLLSLINMI